MNQKTIEFVKCLSDRVTCSAQLFERLRSEMLAEGRLRLASQIDNKTCFLSVEGKRYIKAVLNWFDSVTEMSTIVQAETLFKQFMQLVVEGNNLHSETQTMLNYPGWLDPDKLHIVYGDENSEAFSRLATAIRMELFRIVLAGGERINKISSLTPVHPFLMDYYAYYANNVVPALKTVSEDNRFGYWAYAQQHESRFGKLGKLSVFIAKTPAKCKHRMLPGEYQYVRSGTSGVWQGRGTLTNITPDNILKACDDGIHCHITADQLEHINGFEDPCEDPCNLLGKVFPDSLYAISADEYFAQLNVAIIYRRARSRCENRVCLYCGTTSSNAGLCVNCLAKVMREL